MKGSEHVHSQLRVPSTPILTRIPQDPTGEAASEAQKHLTLYELDLGLNHVVRKQSDPIDNGANMLVPIPGGGDGPGWKGSWGVFGGWAGALMGDAP